MFTPSKFFSSIRKRWISLAAALVVGPWGCIHGRAQEHGNPDPASSSAGVAAAAAAEVEDDSEPAPPPPPDLIPANGLLRAPAPKAPKLKNANYEAYLAALENGRISRLHTNSVNARAVFAMLLEDRKCPPTIQQAALLEMGLLSEQERDFSRAQQVYSQFLRRFPETSQAPEVLLRQGLLYRQMGAPALAIPKFYTVMSSAVSIKDGDVDHYQRLVLQAQTEIADTYYEQGKFEEAIDFFKRILRQENEDLHRARVLLRIIRAYAALSKHDEVINHAQELLQRYNWAAEEAEVRFLLANSLKQNGRARDSLQQVMQLLKSEHARSGTNAASWAYWQRRCGNEIANQLYQEGDYLSALEIYLGLAEHSQTAEWQIPIWYQTGLIYEKLRQPQKAGETYARIIARQDELAKLKGYKFSPSLKSVFEMARWRQRFTGWEQAAGETNRVIFGQSAALINPGGPKPAH